MYLSHYNLRLKPFQITTDPRFIWLGEKHNEALATMIYGIQEDKGFLVLTGEIGTGKTTMVTALIAKLDQSKVDSVYMPNPLLSAMEFMNYIARTAFKDNVSLAMIWRAP